MNRVKRTARLRRLREWVVSDELNKVPKTMDEEGNILLPTSADLAAAHSVADSVVNEFKDRRSKWSRV